MALEEGVGEVLVAHRLADLRLGHERQCRLEDAARAREQELVEVGERDDELDVVLLDELRERRDVGWILDSRHELEVIRVPERGSERVEVGGDRRRARATEGRDDVDALPGAGEEDGCHGAQGIPHRGLLSRVARVNSLPPSATRVLDEVRAAGLDLARVPGSAAKIRLILDLRAELGESGTLRVLDVGCGGLSQPLNVWEPLVPFAERLDVHGVDIDHLEPTRTAGGGARPPDDAPAGERARPDGDVRGGVVRRGREHTGARARSGMDRSAPPDARRPPSGRAPLPHVRLRRSRPGPADRGRLAGKRAFSRLVGRAPAAARILRPLASGEWERGQRLEELGVGARSVGFQLESLERYALRDLKDVRGEVGARVLALAFEEALREETDTTPFAHLYRILYLRARRAP